MSGAAETLRWLTERLDELGIPHMVVGSFASSAHGVPRTTQDIDVVIDPTGEQLRRFVEATKYVTYAERKPDPKEFPLVDPQFLQEPFSLVFKKPDFPVNPRTAHAHNAWWDVAKGAHWKQPEGAASHIRGKY